MISYDEIDALILNRWRETNDGSFIEQFTDDEIEGIAQYISKHKKADFRASDRADKEGVIIDYKQKSYIIKGEKYKKPKMPKKFTKMKAQKIRRGTPQQYDQSTELFGRKNGKKQKKKKET